MTIDIKTFGERIKYLRDTIGLTQEQFADKLGITKGYVSFVEKNKREPSPLLIIAISEVFKVNRSWLESGKGEMNSNKKIFNSELLKNIIKEVEYLFNKHNLDLSPDKKSALIILLYEELTDSNINVLQQEIIKGKVLRFGKAFL